MEQTQRVYSQFNNLAVVLLLILSAVWQKKNSVFLGQKKIMLETPRDLK